LSPGTVEISDAQPDLGWPISRMQLRLVVLVPKLQESLDCLQTARRGRICKDKV
jgi:hypothetical protein